MKVYEVGPRDGLQSAKVRFSTPEKVEMVKMLAKSGISAIEVGSFVNPKLVPSMADSAAVFQEVSGLLRPEIELSALIPNEKGFLEARRAGFEHFNLFFSPSEAFNARNLGKTRIEALSDFKKTLKGVPKSNVRVYISCAFGCPFEGQIEANLLRMTIREADRLGSTVVLCDTVGRATPATIRTTLRLVEPEINTEIALHLHEGPRGRSGLFENIEAAVEMGVLQFDSCIAGLGGCPFMPGSGGNVATEDLVEWAHGRGFDTGVSGRALAEAAAFVANRVGPMEVAV